MKWFHLYVVAFYYEWCDVMRILHWCNCHGILKFRSKRPSTYNVVSQESDEIWTMHLIWCKGLYHMHVHWIRCTNYQTNKAHQCHQIYKMFILQQSTNQSLIYTNINAYNIQFYTLYNLFLIVYCRQRLIFIAINVLNWITMSLTTLCVYV